METGRLLLEIHDRLLMVYGSQDWWPAEDDFEMVVGAILTQATAWVNVEKALGRLKAAGILNPEALMVMPEDVLAQTIRSSGYFNAKARKLKAFCNHLWERHGGRLDLMFHVKLPELREELLGIWGIGPETADSIVLYGARQPIFVVDAYTRRSFVRLGLVAPGVDYRGLQRLFMEKLPHSVPLFQEYHALLVVLGKGICRPTPLCPRCPLRDLCPSAPTP